MRLLIELASKAFQRQLAYRAATIAGLLTNLFFGMLRAAVMVALYAQRDLVGGYDLCRAITFTGLTQALIAPIQPWGWRYVSDSIRSGSVVSELAKPMDYFTYWMAQDMGRATYQALFRGIPIMLAFLLAFRIYLPPSSTEWLLFGLSLALAVLLSFSWNFLVNLSAFWVVDAIGIIRIATMGHLFLSGFLVPAAFFPHWLWQIARLTPFLSIINTPVEIFLGVAQGGRAAQMLLEQVLWLVAVMALGRLVLRQGTRKLVTQGG